MTSGDKEAFGERGCPAIPAPFCSPWTFEPRGDYPFLQTGVFYPCTCMYAKQSDNHTPVVRYYDCVVVEYIVCWYFVERTQFTLTKDGKNES